MNKLLLKSLIATPVALLAAFPGIASANETLDQINQYSTSQGQVTSVSQLKDVQPTDWAFQALQSLVERYGCIAGYPDGTFRGSRAMTRYEFAAGLNSCLDRVNELIASATADLVTKQDLAVLQKLQEEFQAELATLRGRVDALEATTAELKAKQFSTTTKLAGEAIFDVGGLLDGTSRPDNKLTTAVNERSDSDNQITFGSRLRLSLNTSFTGKDLLRTRLQAANIQGYASRFSDAAGLAPGTAAPGGALSPARAFPGAALEYDSSARGADITNNITLNELWYRFPVGKAKVWVGTHGLNQDKVVPFAGSLIAPSYQMSQHFRFQDIYRTPDGAGAAVSIPVAKIAEVTAGYFGKTSEVNSAGTNNGITGGDNSILAQVTFTPTKKLVAAATFTHGYVSAANNAISAGSGIGAGTLSAANAVTGSSTSNNFGISAGYKFSPKFNLSGWANWSSIESADSFTAAQRSATGTVVDEAKVFSWAAQFGFPDLFREGNFGAISFGAMPYVTSSSGGGARSVKGEDTPFAVQGFYSFKVSDNIAIQPGVIYITNPNGNNDNNNVWIGSLKTTFKF
jgi:Carbohydrate-selective porin, OprB family/S-layer homology domain